MDSTAEVRWFFEGGPPAPLPDWFERLGSQPQERVDCYLRLPETDALGVKVRGSGGNLEMKLRTRSHGQRELRDGVAGNVEEWQKWSFQTTGEGPSRQGLGLPSHLWIEVTKVRCLATHGRPGWKPFEEAREDDGCSVELTDLRVAGEQWSTLGFEAFGPQHTILESLARAASAFFEELQLPRGLAANASCGYPGWLQHIEHRPQR